MNSLRYPLRALAIGSHSGYPGSHPGTRHPYVGLPVGGRLAALALMVAGSMASLASIPAVNAAAAGTPSLAVKPTSVSIGSKIAVTGSHFDSREKGVLAIDGVSTGLPIYTANMKGSFRISFVLPKVATDTTHRMSALKESAGGSIERAWTTLTVLGSMSSTATPTQWTTPDPTASPTPTPSPAPTPTPRPSPQVTASPSPASSDSPTPSGVRAYYYLWWSLTHWKDKLGPNYPYTAVPLPLPAITDADGCNEVPLFVGNQLLDVANPLYSQDDPGLIEADIRNAKQAQLDGFLLNWGGNGDPNQTLSSVTYTPRLVEAFAASARVGAFTDWVSYKTSALPSVDFILGDLTFLARELAAEPAWDRVGGKPVLVFTGSRKYGDADLATVSKFAREYFYLIGDESPSTLTEARLSLLDGVSYYWSTQNPWTNPGSFDRLAAMADQVHAAGKSWVAPFAPGYNSRLIGGTTCVPRGDGETMRRLWTGNSFSRPDGWTLISWNEFAENTHVAPLTRWGSRYLQVLGTLVGG